MKIEIDFKEMIKFLEAERYRVAEDTTSFQAFLRLEKFLEIRGPFTFREEKQKKKKEKEITTGDSLNTHLVPRYPN